MKGRDIKYKLIIFITIVSLLFNFYLYKENSKQNEIIVREYLNLLINASLNFGAAHNKVTHITYNPKDALTIKKLENIQDNLDQGKEFLYNFGRIFNYTGNSKSTTSGFMLGRDYIDAHIYTIDEWIKAIENNNSKRIPSTEDLEKYEKDLKNIIDKLRDVYLKVDSEGVNYYSIDDLTYTEFRNTFVNLIEETSNSRTSLYLKRVKYSYGIR